MAVRELQAAANEEGGAWAPPEMARVYQEGGRYDRAIEIIKRSMPNYFAVDIPDLPRPYWEALFPKLTGRTCANIRRKWARSLSRGVSHPAGI